MTNLQSLSVFVTERLTLAAQEIFKAVEVTVTEYHEEISRSRQENELLKRRLLEAGIDLYTELQPSLSEDETGAGPPGPGEEWGPQSEEIPVKLELSATKEEAETSQRHIEPISPKPCLRNEQEMEEMFQPQTSESSVDPFLHAGPFMQIKEEPGDPVPDLRTETFCESQITVSADPAGAAGSGPGAVLQEGLDTHRLSSMHRAVRSKELFWAAKTLRTPLPLPCSSSCHDTTLSLMPLSNKEKAARYRRRIKNDPAAREAYLAKRKESYQRRKREGKIVKAPISQLPTTEQEKVRQHWKQYQRKHRERKRAMEEMVTAHMGLPAEFQHNSSNPDRLLPHNSISYASILQWSAGTHSGAQDEDLNGKFGFT